MRIYEKFFLDACIQSCNFILAVDPHPSNSQFTKGNYAEKGVLQSIMYEVYYNSVQNIER